MQKDYSNDDQTTQQQDFPFDTPPVADNLEQQNSVSEHDKETDDNVSTQGSERSLQSVVESSQITSELTKILESIETKLDQEGIDLFELKNLLAHAHALFIKLENKLHQQKDTQQSFVDSKDVNANLKEITEFTLGSDEIIKDVNEKIKNYNKFLEIALTQSIESEIKNELAIVATELVTQEPKLFNLNRRTEQVAQLFKGVDSVIANRYKLYQGIGSPVSHFNFDIDKSLKRILKKIGGKDKGHQVSANKLLEMNLISEDQDQINEINEFISTHPEMAGVLTSLIAIGNQVRNQDVEQQEQEEFQIAPVINISEVVNAGFKIHDVLEYIRTNTPQHYHRCRVMIGNIILYAIAGWLSWDGNKFYLRFGKEGTQFIPPLFPPFTQFDKNPDAVSWSCFILNYAITAYCIIMVGKGLSRLAYDNAKYYMNKTYRELYKRVNNIDPAWKAWFKHQMLNFFRNVIGIIGLAGVTTRQQLAMQLSKDPSLYGATIVAITYMAANSLSTNGMVKLVEHIGKTIHYQGKRLLAHRHPDKHMSWMFKQMAEHFKKTMLSNWESGFNNITKNSIYIKNEVFQQLITLAKAGDDAAAFKLLFAPFLFISQNANSKVIDRTQWALTVAIWISTAITFYASFYEFLLDNATPIDAALVTIVTFALYAMFAKDLVFNLVDKVVNLFKMLISDRDVIRQINAAWQHRTNSKDFFLEVSGIVFLYVTMILLIAPSIASVATTEDLIVNDGAQRLPKWFVEFAIWNSIPNTMIANLYCMPEVLGALGSLLARALATDQTINKNMLFESKNELKKLLEQIDAIVWLQVFAEICENQPGIAMPLLQAVFHGKADTPKQVFGEFIENHKVQEKLFGEVSEDEELASRTLPETIKSFAKLCRDIGFLNNNRPRGTQAPEANERSRLLWEDYKQMKQQS